MLQSDELHGYKVASNAKRFFAFAADSLIQACVFYLFQYLFFKTTITEYFNEDMSLYDVGINAIIAFVIGAVTYPFFTGNIGHKIFNLKVVDLKNGNDFKSFSDGGLREFAKSLSIMLIVPGIWLLWDKNRQNLYDKITGTVVVER